MLPFIPRGGERMIKLLRERNNILFSLNVNASNNIAELKRLLIENINNKNEIIQPKIIFILHLYL